MEFGTSHVGFHWDPRSSERLQSIGFADLVPAQLHGIPRECWHMLWDPGILDCSKAIALTRFYVEFCPAKHQWFSTIWVTQQKCGDLAVCCIVFNDYMLELSQVHGRDIHCLVLASVQWHFPFASFSECSLACIAFQISLPAVIWCIKDVMLIWIFLSIGGCPGRISACHILACGGSYCSLEAMLVGKHFYERKTHLLLAQDISVSFGGHFPSEEKQLKINERSHQTDSGSCGSSHKILNPLLLESYSIQGKIGVIWVLLVYGQRCSMSSEAAMMDNKFTKSMTIGSPIQGHYMLMLVISGSPYGFPAITVAYKLYGLFALYEHLIYQMVNGATTVSEVAIVCQGSHAFYKVTSVFGHVFSVDFPPAYQNWEATDPLDLIEAPVLRSECNPKSHIRRHLVHEARGCTCLIPWLDCVREGENICYEVIECTGILENEVGRRIFRATFSPVTEKDIVSAMNNLVLPSKDEALSVEAHQEIDLKVCFLSELSGLYTAGDAMGAPARPRAPTLKWLKCPTGASFGFGGLLISFYSTAPAQAAQVATTSTVHANNLVIEQSLISWSWNCVGKDSRFGMDAAFRLESIQEAIQRKCGGVCAFAWPMGTPIFQESLINKQIYLTWDPGGVVYAWFSLMCLDFFSEHINKGRTHQRPVVLGIAFIAMAEELGAEMAVRSLEHLLQYGRKFLWKRPVKMIIQLMKVPLSMIKMEILSQRLEGKPDFKKGGMLGSGPPRHAKDQVTRPMTQIQVTTSSTKEMGRTRKWGD
jgi:hypothetical protein